MKPSLSIFFPCYNDKGTIGTLVWEAKAVAEKLTDDFEIIVIEDGSTDGSRELLLDMQKQYPELKVIFHERNKGYGAVLQDGFRAASKDLVFYTDGDGQYDVRELPRLWEKMKPGIDVVNGFKIKRHDPLHRIVIGYIYQYVMKLAFLLPVKDVDCDFRLIRRKVFGTVHLESTTGTVTIELVKKIQQAGFKFTEVGVSHLFRTYGKSQFFNFKRVFKTLWKLIFLWIDLMILNSLSRPDISIVLRRIVEGNFTKQKNLIRKHILPAIPDGGKVLDLGCGTGEFAPLFKKEQYIGIDLDPANIDYATQHSSHRFEVASGLALPFPDASFDAVIVVGVLHHITDEDCPRVLAEIQRVLKPGKSALIMEDTKSSHPFSRLMNSVDRGAYIRTGDEWKKMFSATFTITEQSTFLSGMGCFYSAFMLKR